MNILTLTLNPAIDKSVTAKMVMPDKKIRCHTPVFQPGGGGINVSRAIKKLGAESVAMYLSGGESGWLISKLLKEENVTQQPISSSIDVRQNLLVYDETTEQQYRFGMPGSLVPEEEWNLVLEEIENLEVNPDYVVASGSLPRGVPNDFYARLAKIAKRNNFRLILDTSGEPLKLGIEEGVYMIKPNLRELAYLAGKEFLSGLEQEKIANQLLIEKKCEIVVLSQGVKGAMLSIDGYETEYIVPPTVRKVSTVGAGDSMLGGILTALSKDWALKQAIRYGVAAGTAATITPDTELCRKEDVDKIYEWMNPVN